MFAFIHKIGAFIKLASPAHARAADLLARLGGLHVEAQLLLPDPVVRSDLALRNDKGKKAFKKSVGVVMPQNG